VIVDDVIRRILSRDRSGEERAPMASAPPIRERSGTRPASAAGRADRRGEDRRLLLGFFALAFGLSWAVWLPAAAASRGLLAWNVPLETSRAVGVFGPAAAALLVAAAAGGRAGLRALLGRLLIWRVGLGWYAFALLWPAVHGLATAAVHVLLGAPRPDFARPPVLWLYPAPPEAFAAGPWPLLPLVLLQSLLLSSPIGEEPGWRGFAQPRLQVRLGSCAPACCSGSSGRCGTCR
jgi:membrane protease YdiL (CAAX protease family)